VKTNRILLVDDNDDVRTVYQQGLQSHGFEVVAASSVKQALGLIASEKFDVLLSDMQMPDYGDGLTIVSAMHHTHPNAVSLLISGYPALQEALNAISLQADEVLTKPIGLRAVVEAIEKKLSNPTVKVAPAKERVAAILERDAGLTIEYWMARVEHNQELKAIPLTFEERTGHLPLLLADIVRRLRIDPTAAVEVSAAARKHGMLRSIQGYTAANVIEESRILQVSIFHTLQKNLATVAFSTVLLDVMTIADEVDSQLKQAILGFMEVPRVIAPSVQAS
jgi:CheY-like chemotaxis protein